MWSEVIGIRVFCFSSFLICTLIVARFDEGGLNQFSKDTHTHKWTIRKIRLVKYNVILSHCEHHLTLKLGKMFDSCSEMLNNRHVITCQMLYNLWYIHSLIPFEKSIRWNQNAHGTFHFSDSAKAFCTDGVTQMFGKCLYFNSFSILFSPSAGKSDIISRYFLQWRDLSSHKYRVEQSTFESCSDISIVGDVSHILCNMYCIAGKVIIWRGRHLTIWTLRVRYSHLYNVSHVGIRLRIAKTKVPYDIR